MLKISCVVPTLNSAKTLDQTLYHLNAQENVDVEIIVVDSGSTDGTLEICDRWNAKVLYAEPGNMYRAINIGLQQCSHDWLAFINSDDWFYPDALRRLIEHGNALQASVVYGSCDYSDGAGRLIFSFAATPPGKLLSLFKFDIFGFAQQSAIFRKQAYLQLEGFDEHYCLSADADFYLRALQLNLPFTFLGGPPVACFRMHVNQQTNRRAAEMKLEKEAIYSKLSKPGLLDISAFIQWRLMNVPHYLLRLLRQSLLSNQITFTDSVNACPHES
jgi:glycosyltransferase involved in cell wall biosynthesis